MWQWQNKFMSCNRAAMVARKNCILWRVYIHLGHFKRQTGYSKCRLSGCVHCDTPDDRWCTGRSWRCVRIILYVLPSPLIQLISDLTWCASGACIVTLENKQKIKISTGQDGHNAIRRTLSFPMQGQEVTLGFVSGHIRSHPVPSP